MWQSTSVSLPIVAAYAAGGAPAEWQERIRQVWYSVKRGSDGRLYTWTWVEPPNRLGRLAAPRAVLEAAAKPETVARPASFLADSPNHWLLT
jgi:hypothetical protein